MRMMIYPDSQARIERTPLLAFKACSTQLCRIDSTCVTCLSPSIQPTPIVFWSIVHAWNSGTSCAQDGIPSGVGKRVISGGRYN